MRFERPLPFYLHPEWAAPETGACLHKSCLGGALAPHTKGLIGNRLKILRAGYKLRGDGEAEILEDIALELMHRYRKIDVPVSHTVGSLLSAIEACGVRRWGWACWEPDWERGAGRTALEDNLEDVAKSLNQMQIDAFHSMSNGLTHNPEQALRNLELAAQVTEMPKAVFAHLIGELNTADLVRLGITPRTITKWTQLLQQSYLEGSYVHP
jgi:hypothetical protein